MVYLLLSTISPYILVLKNKVLRLNLIREAISRPLENEGWKNRILRESMGENAWRFDLIESMARQGRDPEFIAGDSAGERLKSAGLAEAVSMVAYVCAYGFHDRVDYRPGSDFHSVAAKKTKKGMRMFAADKPSFWRMGTAMGEAIRKNANYCRLDHPGLGGTKAPHMRRGHWRNQQCGPRDNPFHKPVFIWPMYIMGHRPLDGETPGLG